eukprot:GEMP01044639.1.p1 GENE.GEMP01044639.1~~GEMP01044639.1.p1  ORF type:complete len:411 (+),score=86.17 GEMP01044639.1:45-1277(+)
MSRRGDSSRVVAVAVDLAVAEIPQKPNRRYTFALTRNTPLRRHNPRFPALKVLPQQYAPQGCYRAMASTASSSFGRAGQGAVASNDTSFGSRDVAPFRSHDTHSSKSCECSTQSPRKHLTQRPLGTPSLAWWDAHQEWFPISPAKFSSTDSNWRTGGPVRSPRKPAPLLCQLTPTRPKDDVPTQLVRFNTLGSGNESMFSNLGSASPSALLKKKRARKIRKSYLIGSSASSRNKVTQLQKYMTSSMTKCFLPQTWEAVGLQHPDSPSRVGTGATNDEVVLLPQIPKAPDIFPGLTETEGFNEQMALETGISILDLTIIMEAFTAKIDGNIACLTTLETMESTVKSLCVYHQIDEPHPSQYKSLVGADVPTAMHWYCGVLAAAFTGDYKPTKMDDSAALRGVFRLSTNRDV